MIPIGKGNVLIGMSAPRVRRSTAGGYSVQKRAAASVSPWRRCRSCGGHAPRHGVYIRRPGLRISSTPLRHSPSGRPKPSAVSSCARTASRSATSCLRLSNWEIACGGKPVAAPICAGVHCDSGAKLVFCALSDVVFANDRNTYTGTLLRRRGIGGHHHSGGRTGPGSWWRACMTCPLGRDPLDALGRRHASSNLRNCARSRRRKFDRPLLPTLGLALPALCRLQRCRPTACHIAMAAAGWRIDRGKRAPQTSR